MKLKQSVKDYMMIGLLIILFIGGMQILKWRSGIINNQLEQQKMTESVAMNQSK